MKFSCEGQPILWYHDEQHIRYACEWFWEQRMTPLETAKFLRKLYQYEDLIIAMAYTMFLENVRPNDINFNKLVERKIFINPFQTT